MLWPSSEQSHQDSSYEGLQHMVLCRINKNYLLLSPNTPSYLELCKCNKKLLLIYQLYIKSSCFQQSWRWHYISPADQFFFSVSYAGLYHDTASSCTYSGLPFIFHLKIPWLFPEYSLTTLQITYPFMEPKLILHFTLTVLIISLENWELLLEERISSQGNKFFPLTVVLLREGRCTWTISLKATPFPLGQNIKYTLWRLSYPQISKFPYSTKKMPDFSLTWGKKFIFQIFFSQSWGNFVIAIRASWK